MKISSLVALMFSLVLALTLTPAANAQFGKLLGGGDGDDVPAHGSGGGGGAGGGVEGKPVRYTPPKLATRLHWVLRGWAGHPGDHG